MRLLLAVIALLLLGLTAAAASPAVTIDSNGNFSINGQPTFLIGTIGGNASDWQNYLAPAGFNFRFLGSTSTPGAHDAGAWELPDVFSDPSAVVTMKNDPYYLMWDLGWEVDGRMQDQFNWMGYTAADLANKYSQVLSYDGGAGRQPVGICWGNVHRYLGLEFAARDGYWITSRQYAQLADYFVGGDYNWVEEQTAMHTVLMAGNKPAIVINRLYPIVDWSGSPTWCTVNEVRQDFWQAVIAGAKGIVLDRFETTDSTGNRVTWVASIDPPYWNTIQQTASELRALNHVLTAPGPRVYFKTTAVEDPWYWIMYTFRKVGSDLYLIAMNMSPYDTRSGTIPVPTLEINATGEDYFDYLFQGAVLSNPTATSFIGSSNEWTTNQLAGHRLWVRHGSPEHDHYYPIASNTTNTITIASGNLVTDGVQRGDFYKVIRLQNINNGMFSVSLPPGGRKVIKFANTTYYPPAQKTAAAVGTPSNRRWVELMDYSSATGSGWWPADGYGLAYDSHRHRLIAQGGVNYNHKSNVWDPDVWMNSMVWEWDLDTGYYTGWIYDGMQQGGAPWPSGGTYYHDIVYDPVRQCTMVLTQDDKIGEWRGIEQGWTVVDVAIPNREGGPLSHYSACYDPSHGRFLIYGGKDHTEYGSQGRGMQFLYEWSNILYAYDGTTFYNFKNYDANLPATALEEPVMVWDSSRGSGVLFGLSHDGRYNKDVNPRVFFQDTPQQTYSVQLGTNAIRKNTSHVPYVYANYQMVFDPRSNTTLLFGGLPTVNGRYTDLYEYNGTDWKRLDYHAESLPAQDARRTPSLTWDPDHQMVLFLDTRQGKIWGLTDGQETRVESLEQARSLPNGTKVLVEGMTVSRRYNGYFYMQNADRTDGIRVVSASAAATEGKVVNVIGAVATLATGEKQIVASMVGTGVTSEVRPLGMTNDSLGGPATASVPGVTGADGVNNVGLLVRVCGKVTYVGSGFVYVDDGSGVSDGSGYAGVKVQLNGIGAPALGDYVAVTGVSGIESISGHNARVLLLAKQEDMSTF